MPETKSKPSAVMNQRRDLLIVERECKQIMQPYIELLSDLYARSTSTMISKGNGFAEVIYPPETEECAAGIRGIMRTAVNLHLSNSGYASWEPESGSLG